MPIRTEPADVTASMDCSTSGSSLPQSVDCSGYSVATAQFILTDGTFGSTELAVKRSNDNATWQDMETPVLLSSDGAISQVFDVWGVKYITVQVTTPTSGVKGKVFIHLEPAG